MAEEEPRWVKQPSKRYESYNRPPTGKGFQRVTDFPRWAEKRNKPREEPKDRTA